MPYFGVTPAAEFTSKDLNGSELILDADADTTITADTDDQIDIRISGADDFQFTANTFTAQSGSTIAAQALTGTTGVFSSDVTGLTLNATGDTAAADNAAIGYTSAEGLILTGQGSTNDITIKRDDDTAVLEVATGQSDIEVTGGDLLFGTAGKGVCLGVTTNTDSNTLDDYEEGTFTATLYFGENDNGDSSTNTYTKIGNAVRIAVQVLADSSITGTGTVQIRGLPFTNSDIGTACSFTLNDRIFLSTLKMYVTGAIIAFTDAPSSTSDTAAGATQAIFGTGAGKWLTVAAVYYV
jgi:hypothetical protein